MPTAVPPYLHGLNEAQRLAVETLDGPLLVLSGAGTGKTRVLTARLVHLLSARRVWPSQILALTFTNKAAREMRERVAAMLGQPVEGWWIGTFHALAARMLRRHAELVGLTSSFSILDTDDQLRLIRQLLQAAGVDDKRWPARTVLGVIERWKDKGLGPEALSPLEARDVAGGKLQQIYAAYQARLRDLNGCDFGDLINHLIAIFDRHPDVLAEWQRRFRYIMVDEYQDTNGAQYMWLQRLASGHGNLAVVGDDDQSIYGWRGAEVGNILRFETDWPGARIVRLEQNYRSTGHILAAASAVIGHNKGRLGKALWTAGDEGERVRVRTCLDSQDEARFIVDEIEALQRQGEALGSMAILVRAVHQTRALEERLIETGTPYRMIGGPRFYERQEIRDALAYLRVTAQPTDDLAFERIVNIPKRGVGDATLVQIRQAARALAGPGAQAGLFGADEVRGTQAPLLAATAHLVASGALKPKLRQVLGALVQGFARWRGQIEQLKPADLAKLVLEESGYIDMWQSDRAPEARDRLDNLKELASQIAEFDTLQAFLDHVALVMDATSDAEGDRVTLMTLHAAKGLEFATVFLPGWEEGLFPNQRAMDESGIAGLEEERRLAYVGITRARRRAIVCLALRRQTFGAWNASLPSRFVDELPSQHVTHESSYAPGVMGGYASPGGYAGGAAAYGGGAQPGDGFERFMATNPQWRGADRVPGQPSRPEVLDVDGAGYVVPTRPPARSYAVGARIFHDKFGYGTVAAVDEDKVEVAFDQAGTKCLMASFVRPAAEA